MIEKKVWTVEEDRMLKYVFQTSGLNKWSHIARKLQQEYGIKGRNGKQCKERYITYIDTSHPKGDWSYQDEQRMFDLHNQLGNKWAIIGTKLGGRSDNCVKNHFYSKLRKALRKINKVIHDHFHKQMKEIKPSALYRIVEVAQQNFKLFPCFDKEFSIFANQFKNQLLQFSYDDQIQQSNQQANINVDMAKDLIQKMVEFSANYKRKAKRQRKSSAQGQDLLTPNRYQQTKKNSAQNDQSEGTALFINSSQVSNGSDISDDEVSCSNKDNKSRKNSVDSSHDEVPVIRTRTRSHGNFKHGNFEMQDNYEIKQHQIQIKVPEKGERIQSHEKIQEEHNLQSVLGGMNILEEDHHHHHLPTLLMNKQASRYSRNSDNLMEGDQYHYSTNFFEDSQIEMRILPQFSLRRQSQAEENIFN